MEALGQRPYLRAFIQGLTTRWEQNNEPPPAPPQLDAESSTNTGSGSGWKNQAQEEDYFNGSDEEDTPKRPNKRQKPVSNATPTRGRANTGVQRSPTTRSKPSLGLDYDDGSDSDGSNGTQSPRQPGGSVDATHTQELEEDLGDVALRMRAKRQREEEDDEGFAGLLGMAKAAGGGSMAKEKEKETETEIVKAEEKLKSVTPKPVKEEKKEVNTPGKRLKLHLGFGKKKS